jgi:hypothetical protein
VVRDLAAAHCIARPPLSVAAGAARSGSVNRQLAPEIATEEMEFASSTRITAEGAEEVLGSRGKSEEPAELAEAETAILALYYRRVYRPTEK